jgi:hypothetical protein
MSEPKKKKITKQVRVSLKHYEIVRRVAFRSHVTMTALLEQLVDNYRTL